MTLSTQTSRNDYTGNGATTAFAYTYPIDLATDLLVTLRSTAGVESTAVNVTDYAVSGVGAATGGNVTFVTAPASGVLITIRRVPPLTQTTDLRNQGAFLPESYETGIDKVVKEVQSIKDETSRSLHLMETEAGTSLKTQLPSVTDRASKFLGFDASGNPIAASAITGGTAASAYMQTVLDDADAATAQSTLGFSGIGSHTVGLVNVSVACSVSANALTVTLRDKDGNNPSAGSPVKISFRSMAEDGKYVVRSVTAATQVVVSSGSTLAHISGQAFPIFVYALDVAGTVELAISSTFWGDGLAMTTTAEGGAGAADSGVIPYSTTARANVASRLIARLQSNQVTAGTWAVVPERIWSGSLEHKIFSLTVAPMRMEFAQISLTTPSVTATSSNWISGVTRPANGRLSFTARGFQASPIILVTAFRGLDNTRYICSAWVSSTSSAGNGLWTIVVEFAFYDDNAATIALAQSTDNAGDIFILATGF